MLVMILVFPLSAKLILMERNSLLPSMPARGHGLILLIFWILVFISENVAFITMKKDDWSIKLNKSVNNYFDYKFLFNYIHIIIFINNNNLFSVYMVKSNSVFLLEIIF